MVSLRESPANRKMLEQLRQVVGELVSEALQQGFHGTAELKLKVHDGTIHEIRHLLERVER
jgi:hypothetical protein